MKIYLETSLENLQWKSSQKNTWEFLEKNYKEKRIKNYLEILQKIYLKKNEENLFGKPQPQENLQWKCLREIAQEFLKKKYQEILEQNYSQNPSVNF